MVKFDPLLNRWLELPEELRRLVECPTESTVNERTHVRNRTVRTFHPALGEYCGALAPSSDPLQNPLDQPGVWFEFTKTYDGWFFSGWEFQNLEKIEKARFVEGVFDQNGYPNKAFLTDVEPGFYDWGGVLSPEP